MKRSDQLLKSALEAKAGETEAATIALESIASKLKADAADLATLKEQQLAWLRQNHEAALNAKHLELQAINGAYEADVANCNLLFNQLIEKCEGRLEQLSDFERRMVKGFDEPANTKQPKMKIVAGERRVVEDALDMS